MCRRDTHQPICVPGRGAGYIFSAALLRWVATSEAVGAWVAEAAGPSREGLQWQKFEDTSTGYWLSYSNRTVHYVDIGPLVHDVACHPEGGQQRDGDGTYRPPANTSLLVHNLKSPSAFGYAFDHMAAEALPYQQNECAHGVYGVPLKDAATQRAEDGRRSGKLWSRAARGERAILMAQHNLYLQAALLAVGLGCPRCRKQLMVERMLRSARRKCSGRVASGCIKLVGRVGSAGLT
jgi:hypothetical protein